jgi:O-acetylhomoserine (thiol)-lyase
MNYSFETKCVHGNYDPFKFNKSRAVPLFQSAAFVYENTQDAADLFSFDKEGHIYMRLDNPTVKEAEDRIAMLEKGIGAVCFASGMAAVTGFVFNFLQSGDRILSGMNLYGGTSGLFKDTLPKLGINTDFFDPENCSEMEKMIRPDTKLVWVENLANPGLSVPDLKAISAVCRKHKIPLAVDNTIATPLLCTPIDYGADFIMHSCTKYLEGHGNILGGIIIDAGTFEFSKDRYPMMFEEVSGGKNFVEKFGKMAFLGRLRGKVLMNTGGTMAPFHAYMLIHGLESFHVRMERHCENAEKIVDFLSKHEKISWVKYPKLKNHPSHENAKKYLNKYFGAMVGFGIKLLTHTTNIGDTKTLVIHPASTTHRNLSDAEKEKAGISKDFIRLSVGIENADDLIREISKTLEII